MKNASRMPGMRPGVLIATLSFACLPLSACGQKGPLTLPLPSKAPASHQTPEAPATAAPVGETKPAKP